VDVTTNRPDAMNHRGLAREAATAGCGTLRPLVPDVFEGSTGVAELGKVTVVDPAGCPRYCARVIRGVTVGPSPAWLAERLERCGIRPINNVVDATNHVLLDLGQPLHAFDLDLLAGREIVVRRAVAGERFTTLDGVERALVAADLVIADRDRAVALAGVMGGANSEISGETRDVLLESACFEPLTVRRTARRLGLSTEASFRFERGTDPAMARTAADVAAALIRQLAGGEVAAGVLDSAPVLAAPSPVARSRATGRSRSSPPSSSSPGATATRSPAPSPPSASISSWSRTSTRRSCATSATTTSRRRCRHRRLGRAGASAPGRSPSGPARRSPPPGWRRPAPTRSSRSRPRQRPRPRRSRIAAPRCACRTHCRRASP
jgi:hypothetical protein